HAGGRPGTLRGCADCTGPTSREGAKLHTTINKDTEGSNKLRKRVMSRLLSSSSLALVLASVALGGPVDYVRDVRPILEKHCYGCHGEKRQRAGLRLDVRSEAFKGGVEFGASIVPGKPDKSPLVRFVSRPDAELQMPPGKELSEEEVATLTK